MEGGGNICRQKSYSPDEQVCEEFYQKTTRQDEIGQYIVSLPWKIRDQLSSAHLENSHSAALRALNRLEANFAKDEKLKLAYIDFMKEYIDLGHSHSLRTLIRHLTLPNPSCHITVCRRKQVRQPN